MNKESRVFLKRGIAEANGHIVLDGTDYCRSFLARHRHVDCPHLPACAQYWLLSEKLRNHGDILPEEFEIDWDAITEVKRRI